jgi:sarcosine oxidase gamma subunit
MKTLLISEARVPDVLREIVERGSTHLDALRATETDAAAISSLAPDRVVFWHVAGNETVRRLADAVAKRDPAETTSAIVFVSEGADTAAQWLAPDQVFVWPHDEDRLRMAFMTGG